MEEAKIVLVAMPQSDGFYKNRPALVLRKLPSYADFLVCGISTQLHQEVKGFDEVIAADDNDFQLSGLRSTSLIRLGFLAVVNNSDIIGEIGELTERRYKELIRRLADYLTRNSTLHNPN